jgi:hypothetical protein
MAEGNGSNWFSTKDAVVAIPVTASVLALCWEVGSFLPIGGASFSYFSISEHLAFAAPALPFALGLAVLTFFNGLGAGSLIHRMMYGRWRHDPGNIVKLDSSARRILSRLRAGSVVTCFVLFFGSAAAAYLSKSATLGAAALSVLLIGSISISPLRPYWVPRFLAIGIGISLLLLAFTLGVDSTRVTLNETDAETTIIDTVDGQLTAIVIRSGERGVLLYDRSRQRFAFRKWDSIKRAEWSRQPLLRLLP